MEIDPFLLRSSTPVKRTALGRLKHEGAWVDVARDGRLVVYMGDDEQFEYIYRYVPQLAVEAGLLEPASTRSASATGSLYVARFLPDGWGEWLPLTPNNPGALRRWSLYNDILINTRGAGRDLVGVTPMDRPEWIDTFDDAT